MFLYKNKPFQIHDLLLNLGLPADTPITPDMLVEHNVQRLKWVMPTYDEQWQYLTHVGAVFDPVLLTYTPAIVNIRLYAQVNNDGLVVDLSQSPADGWIPVPYELNRHIQIGWMYVDDTESFAPPSISAFQSQLKAAAEQTAEEARNTLARSVGPTEIGTWLMNYVGVSLFMAGLPTPLWDKALVIEAGMTGETVETLRTTHIQRASEWHALVALTQGFSRMAKGMFASTNDMGALVTVADKLRQQAASAMADPKAYLNRG